MASSAVAKSLLYSMLMVEGEARELFWQFFMKLFITTLPQCGIGICKKNKKALLSQRRPRDAPNIWVP